MIRPPRTSPPHCTVSPPGFSLFEVLLALALLAASLTAISQLIDTGTQASIRNQWQTEGSLLCDSKLAEILASNTPPTSTSNTPFPDNPGWSWSVNSSAGPRADLLRIEVIVTHHPSNDSNTEDFRISIIRLLRVPTEETSTSTTFRPLRSKTGAA